MFGDPNLQNTAQNKILAMKMKDTARVSEYVVNFSALAPYTGWNDVGLAGQLYRGLPDHLKDMFQYIPCPQTPADMHRAALDFDQRHWKRQEEAGRTQKSISNKPNSGRKAGND